MQYNAWYEKFYCVDEKLSLMPTCQSLHVSTYFCFGHIILGTASHVSLKFCVTIEVEKKLHSIDCHFLYLSSRLLLYFPLKQVDMARI